MDQPDRPKTSEDLIREAKRELRQRPQPPGDHAAHEAADETTPAGADAADDGPATPMASSLGEPAPPPEADQAEPMGTTAAPAPPPPTSRATVRALTLGFGLAVAALVLWLRADGSSVTSITAGDCLVDPGLGEISRIETIDCGEPHAFEAFARVTLPAGPYPGDFEVVVDAIQRCIDHFEGYVGQPIEESDLFADAFVPTESVWDTGNREALCVLFEADDEFNPIPRVGSARAGA